MVTLGHVARNWLPTTVGYRLEEDIRSILLHREVRVEDLDAWEVHSHGGSPYLALAQNLKSCIAWDHSNPTPYGVVPLWPISMDMDDAMAWLIVFCQVGRLRGPDVRAWDAHTPHGWAFLAAGITLTEALNGSGSLGWDRLRTMAALRDVALPHRPSGFEVATPTVPTGDQRPFMVLTT